MVAGSSCGKRGALGALGAGRQAGGDLGAFATQGCFQGCLHAGALALAPARCKDLAGRDFASHIARLPHEPLSCIGRCRIWAVNSKEVRIRGHNDCPCSDCT